MKTLRVNEIFHSIQGESTWAGERCAFIRLSGCNLRCGWCDTRYSFDEQGRELTVGMIVEAIRPFNATVVEITGGEPLLQEATPELAAALLAEKHTVLVETNGSMDISVLPYPTIRITDLKPPSSGMSGRNRLANFAHMRRGDEVKIVIADRVDFEWAKAMMRDPAYPANMVKTSLSPVRDKVEAATLAEWIMREKLDVRLNLQLHKYIWPDIERGV